MELQEVKQTLKEAENQAKDIALLLNVEKLEKDIENIESKTYENTFWDDHQKAQQIIEKLKMLKQKLKLYYDVLEQLEDVALSCELLEMGEEIEVESLMASLKDKLTELETEVYLSEEYDRFNAIVEVHPGAGGTESQDWASMLYRMISRYAEQNNFSIELNDYQDGLEAGLKSVTMTISGINAYGILKSESGVHRLVRISPFDASGRRHTSFASINIIPEIDDTISVELDESDLKIDTYRSSGAGGQSVNTTDSAVRITHLPTKLTVTCQNERSQIKNRERALTILKGKLYQKELEKQKETLSSLKSGNQSIDFGSQIRSYVMHPYSMVKDHRTNIETGNVQKVLDGDLSSFTHAYLKFRVKEQTNE